jgi:alkylation response protein AidB-like acyl-CoA dehydrogenase
MTRVERDAFVLRHNSFTLEEERAALRDVFRTFFEKQCPSERVRAAEPVGWDPKLWEELAELRAVAMAVPVSAGGDGAGLVELSLVCEEMARRAAPVPLVETLVGARLLARVGGDTAGSLLDAVLEGAVVTVAPGAPAAGGRVLTPAGAAASFVLAQRGDDLVCIELPEPLEHVENLGSAPLAWCDLSAGVPLATGGHARELLEAMGRDWRILSAAALVGLGEAALGEGVQYAKDRHAFGVPIGTFQAVAHALVDAAIGVTSARRLTWKAAWFADHDPEAAGALPSMAFLHASESAEQAASTSIHTQGGFGFTLESDVQLYYRRAKAWSLLSGDRRQELQRIGRQLIASEQGAREVA